MDARVKYPADLAHERRQAVIVEQLRAVRGQVPSWSPPPRIERRLAA
jgi:hypothetical protein